MRDTQKEVQQRKKLGALELQEGNNLDDMHPNKYFINGPYIGSLNDKEDDIEPVLQKEQRTKKSNDQSMPLE